MPEKLTSFNCHGAGSSSHTSSVKSFSSTNFASLNLTEYPFLLSFFDKAAIPPPTPAPAVAVEVIGDCPPAAAAAGLLCVPAIPARIAARDDIFLGGALAPEVCLGTYTEPGAPVPVDEDPVVGVVPETLFLISGMDNFGRFDGGPPFADAAEADVAEAEVMGTVDEKKPFGLAVVAEAVDLGRALAVLGRELREATVGALVVLVLLGVALLGPAMALLLDSALAGTRSSLLRRFESVMVSEEPRYEQHG